MDIKNILEPISYQEEIEDNFITEGLWTREIVDFLYFNTSKPKADYEIYQGIIPSGGKPLVVRHGTDYIFDRFDAEKLKSEKDAIFFVTDNKVADAYGKNILECYISMNNPCIIRFKNFIKPYNFEEILDNIRSQGYDGIITIIDDNAYDGLYGEIDVYIVFSPDQVEIINKEKV